MKEWWSIIDGNVLTCECSYTSSRLLKEQEDVGCLIQSVPCSPSDRGKGKCYQLVLHYQCRCNRIVRAIVIQTASHYVKDGTYLNMANKCGYQIGEQAVIHSPGENMAFLLA